MKMSSYANLSLSMEERAIVVNQALPSLYGESLKNTLKIPKTLINKFIFSFVPGCKPLTGQRLLTVSTGETFTMPGIIAVGHSSLGDNLNTKFFLYEVHRKWFKLLKLILRLNF